jgi:hypothetical protein
VSDVDAPVTVGFGEAMARMNIAGNSGADGEERMKRSGWSQLWSACRVFVIK